MGRAGRVALAAAGGVVALLVVTQLVLPSLAERRLRDRLREDGEVQRVEVSAFPAVKLLWHRADRVEVRMGKARAGPGRLADRLAETADTGELDARVAELTLLVLRVHDVRLRKRDDRLVAEASVSDADLRASLPSGFDVRPVASGGGALVFEGTAALLGQRFSGRVVVAARDGKVLLAPDLPFGGLLSLTLFEDSRIEVTDVGARASAGGFTLTATARVR
jgi:hypothetical protein